MQKKTSREMARKEKDYSKRMEIERLKNVYVRNTLAGKYYLERCNMIVTQLNSDKIEEKIDGCTKSRAFIYTEYAMNKLKSTDSFREAHFSKEELTVKHNVTEADLKKHLEDYMSGKMIRKEYEKKPQNFKKAEFVNE